MEARQPFGIVMVAVVLTINGIAAIVGAVAAFRYGHTMAGAISAVIGLALVHRAFGLWKHQHGAWMVTFVLLCLKGILSVWPVFLDSSSIAAWLNLVIVVVACSISCNHQ